MQNRENRLKWISLATLVLQNSSLVLVMHYSQKTEGPKYNPATAVLSAEFLKLLICLAVHVTDRKEHHSKQLIEDVFGRDSNWIQMTVPAFLYFIQNNLQYAGAKLLNAATYQISCQFKIITTAIFAVALLHKRLSGVKWFSLICLTVGIGLVNISTQNGNEKDSSFTEQSVGLIAIFSACTLSGIAGIWFEKVLKGTHQSVVLRNIQLSLFSCISGLLMGRIVSLI
jgi:solute carrier family 35 (UDP-sugar transporter), member A1/2/3